MVLSISFLFAQSQYATTANGKKVILKDDGTWHYATSTTKNTRATKSNRSQHANRLKSSTRNYITGPRGGCYYINSNGNKTYVDRSMCN